MADNLIHRLLPHQGCVITRTADGIDIAGSANLRMHWHRGELIFNWECSVRELRVHDPATAEQHGIKDQGFISPNEWHEILWEIGLARMRVVVDGEVRFEAEGDYSGLESAPSVGPCFGSTVSIRECSIEPRP